MAASLGIEPSSQDLESWILTDEIWGYISSAGAENMNVII